MDKSLKIVQISDTHLFATKIMPCWASIRMKVVMRY